MLGGVEMIEHCHEHVFETIAGGDWRGEIGVRHSGRDQDGYRNDRPWRAPDGKGPDPDQPRQGCPLPREQNAAAPFRIGLVTEMHERRMHENICSVRARDKILPLGFKSEQLFAAGGFNRDCGLQRQGRLRRQFAVHRNFKLRLGQRAVDQHKRFRRCEIV